MRIEFRVQCGERCALFQQLVVSCDQQRLQRFGIELIEVWKSSGNHERSMP